MQSLKAVYLKGNEMTRNIPNYRKFLIKALPILTYLDDRPVNEGDHLAAEAFYRGGLEEEKKVREDWKKRKDLIGKIREKESSGVPFDERRSKAIQSLRNEYLKRKETLESKKKELKKELQNVTSKEKKMEINYCYRRRGCGSSVGKAS